MAKANPTVSVTRPMMKYSQLVVDLSTTRKTIPNKNKVASSFQMESHQPVSSSSASRIRFSDR